jgi:hypothetical protein
MSSFFDNNLGPPLRKEVLLVSKNETSMKVVVVVVVVASLFTSNLEGILFFEIIYI